jgi:hypothetical protein
VAFFLDLFWLLVYESWMFLHVPFVSYEQNRRTLSMDPVLCMDVFCCCSSTLVMNICEELNGFRVTAAKN